jgi:hypothetical protein
MQEWQKFAQEKPPAARGHSPVNGKNPRGLASILGTCQSNRPAVRVYTQRRLFPKVHEPGYIHNFLT